MTKLIIKFGNPNDQSLIIVINFYLEDQTLIIVKKFYLEDQTLIIGRSILLFLYS